jgi:hypothetical protein
MREIASPEARRSDAIWMNPLAMTVIVLMPRGVFATPELLLEPITAQAKTAVADRPRAIGG